MLEKEWRPKHSAKTLLLSWRKYLARPLHPSWLGSLY